MIYKILGSCLTDALATGGEFIIFSSDGTYALVKSKSEIKGSLSTYNESELSKLYNDPLFKQPCKDC